MAKYHFSTKDLVTIAILASLGGAMSTYVGYLGNLVNRLVGVPFGAGQFMAGLHIIWTMIALGITGKKGTGTVTGTVKGLVELFLGGTHGIVIVVVSAVQGGLADVFLLSDRAKRDRGLIPYSLAGGVSSASNVLVFQAFYFSGVPWALIMVLTMLAAGSGIIFGGWFAVQVLDTLEHGGFVLGKEEKRPKKRKARTYAAVISTVIILGAFTVGAVYYFSNVYVPPGKEGIEVAGNVENEYVFQYSDFKDSEVTVRAELIGSVSYEAPRNYTGIPLNLAINRSRPKDNADELRVRAKDGYSASFDLEEVLGNDEIIITREDGGYRLVAANYDGGYWVRDVHRIEIL